MREEKVRRNYIFHGEVQGVGFRFRAYHLAERYGITGWVANRYDGTVELEAEGYPEAIRCLLEGLYSDRFIRIMDMEVRNIPLCGSKSFEYHN